MRRVRALIVCLAGIVSTGCMTLHVRSIDHDFEGLRTTMDRSHVVCMLLVHGMGGYSVGDPDALIDAIKHDLHLQAAGSPLPATIPDGAGGVPGTLIRQDFIGGAGNMLRIYTLYWEPLTYELKKKYLAFDDTRPVTQDRLPIHNELKQLLMNGNVPDVVLYGGDFKAALQNSVRITLKQIRSDLGDEKDFEYFFVSFSLGSKIIFDVVDQMVSDRDHPEGDEIVDRTASFFMLANQFPLFALASVPPTTSPAEANNDQGYETMLRFIERKRERRAFLSTTQPSLYPLPDNISIVAVSDPNDLFSYTIPPRIRDRYPESLINVQMSVAKTAYLVPTYGYIANPLTAHTGYGHDPEVIRLIIDGAKAAHQH